MATPGPESKDSFGGNAMQQFLALANSSRGLAAVELIKNLLKHQSVFLFGDFLEHPNIRALEATEHKPYVDLLRIFAYGMYSDYKAQAARLPELAPAQKSKLKQLTIVSMAAQQKSLSYKQLMAELDVSNVRELEDMIIECIYADLIAGKLDQKALSVEVQHAISRDVRSSDVPAMTATLDAWLATSDRLLVTLAQQMEQADKAYERREAEEKKLQAYCIDRAAVLRKHLQEQRTGGNLAAASRLMAGTHDMDVDPLDNDSGDEEAEQSSRRFRVEALLSFLRGPDVRP